MIPLSQPQIGLWSAYLLNDDKAMFNTAECITLRGKIDAQWLSRAVAQAVSEAQCLNVHFFRSHVAGEGMAVGMIPATETITLSQLDLPSGIASEDSFVRDWAWEDLAVPFDLEQERPCRFALLHGESCDYLYCCIHHIALDGYGTTLLFQRIADIYSALACGSDIPAADWGSFAELLDEEASRVASGSENATRAYWLERLAGAKEPASFSDAKAPIAARFLRQSCRLPAILWQQIQELALALKVSWADLLLAAISSQLSLYSARSESTLGLMVMNRIGSASLRLPCMQMNIVPLHLELDGSRTLGELAKHVARVKREMRKHQHYRYEWLRRDLGRVGGQQRLFGPLINIMPFDHPLHYGGIPAQTMNISAGPVEDLTIEVHIDAKGEPYLDYDANPACYDADMLVQLQQELMQLLTLWSEASEASWHQVQERLFAQRRQQSLLMAPQEECVSLLAPVVPVLSSIEVVATQSPERIALVHADMSLSYHELWQQVGQVTNALLAHGIQTGSRVGMLLERSAAAIVTQLAILRAGCTYVPLDPAQPDDRQRHIIQSASLAVIITQASFRHRIANLFPGLVLLAGDLLSNDQILGNPVEALPPADAIAYLMFTSGSTGLPKGVALSHGALNHFVRAAGVRYGLRAEMRVLQFAPFNFDASIEEVFTTLSHGATLVLRNDAMLESMSAFAQQVEQWQIQLLDLPTAFWNEWVVALQAEHSWIPDCVQAVIIGGEAIYPDPLACWQRIAPSSVRLINTYGPTEATVVVTSCELQAWPTTDGALPIGRLLPGMQGLILAQGDRPALEGELVLAGPHLASGYLGGVSGGFSTLQIGSQWCTVYRTGDRVRLQDGQLVYLGRLDNEFKISGYRIQPGEIESHLLDLPGVSEACVQGIAAQGAARRLVAFYAGTEQDSRSLRQQLLKRLPAAMVPTDYRWYAQLPRTGSNKIDRKHLQAEYLTSAKQVALDNETQERIRNIWQDVLGVMGISAQDNFFELGGQSLQTIQIVNRLNNEFAVSLKVSNLFDHPVLADFSIFLDGLLLQSESSVEMVW